MNVLLQKNLKINLVGHYVSWKRGNGKHVNTNVKNVGNETFLGFGPSQIFYYLVHLAKPNSYFNQQLINAIILN